MASAAGGEEDRELDELLDSALDDFEKTKLTPPSPSSEAKDTSKKPSKSTANETLFASQEQFFNELFDSELAAQATAEFEKAMKELAEEEPQLVEQFQKLSEAAEKVGSDAGSQQEFTSCLKDTLSGLAKNANDLQNPGLSEEELARTMEGLGLEEGDGDGNILPIMQSIMQNLLSKDVLYPSLKEITEKYPDWLHVHRDSIPTDQFRKYEQQHCIMGKICEQFEAESPLDSDDAQKARFEKILDLMQQLQDLGHPPEELAGDSPPGLNFGFDGMNLSDPAAAAAGSEQCVVM
ncbi:peroxisomal biogenesis factor 19 [Latimeria chalumnae]|uniref:Peroxisomal biogenesis factor 19 n=1 Tax=Latimeria chalumnae TaxID=7897 RepID=H3AJ25_LATCH|nr:PREDICTED: peroxisomal biogenesis factor 19 [Latimeria chalumnae]|eukprot:XP_006001921.1 PREDICTED: peroxisomal biogenesis factor 19 [Latimeria chalumnae]